MDNHIQAEAETKSRTAPRPQSGEKSRNDKIHAKAARKDSAAAHQAILLPEKALVLTVTALLAKFGKGLSFERCNIGARLLTPQLLSQIDNITQLGWIQCLQASAKLHPLGTFLHQFSRMLSHHFLNEKGLILHRPYLIQ